MFAKGLNFSCVKISFDERKNIIKLMIAKP